MLKPICLLVLSTLPGWASPAQPQLIIYHPGSVSPAFKALEELYARQSGVAVVDVAGGSVGIARQVTAGREPCDLFASADVELIDRMLKPAGFADYSIRFAAGAMVLAYTTASRNAATIAAPGTAFHPPASIPAAAPDWYAQLTRPGVKIAGSHPFLDPGGYRADLIFQLAQARYGVPNLYNDLLAHYQIGGGSFDYQFSYEHGARAAARADQTGTYRYVRLPDEVSLGVPGLNALYGARSIALPGLQTQGAAATVAIPATRVTWGITMLNKAANRDQALAFLQLLFSPQGAALLNATGPDAISPATVSAQDFTRLPPALKALVRPD